MKNINKQNGFGAIILIIAILITAAITATGYYVYNKVSNNNKPKNDSAIQTVSVNATPTPATAPTIIPTATTIATSTTKYSSEDLLKTANTQKCSDGSSYATLRWPITSNGWAELSSGCGSGGASAIWHYTNGKWVEVTAYQSSLWCTIIDKYQVSSQLHPYCFNNVENGPSWQKVAYSEEVAKFLAQYYPGPTHILFTKADFDSGVISKNPIQ